MPKIAARARQLRFELQLKLGRTVPIQEVATAIGMDRERLNKIELGRIKGVSNAEFVVLCQYYSAALERTVDTNEIIGYDPNNKWVVSQGAVLNAAG